MDTSGRLPEAGEGAATESGPPIPTHTSHPAGPVTGLNGASAPGAAPAADTPAAGTLTSEPAAIPATPPTPPTLSGSASPTRAAGSAPPAPWGPSGLAYFPVGLFAAVMGIGGLSLAWRRAGAVLGLPHWPSQVLFWIAAAVFVLVASLYLTKWVRYPAAARAETRHPIQLAFVPTLTIGLLVLATAGQDLMPQVARVAWWVGAVGHLTLTVAILSAWFRRPEIVAGTITPAWFIPIVGNVVTPLAAPAVGSTEFAWFAFGVGLLLWIAFLPLVLQRILTHDAPLPPRLTPTLAVFIAPPAMTMLSWQSLTGRLDDPMSRILYAVTITFVVLLAVQAERLLAVPFAVPAWAYTFPLTAAAAAALAFAGAHPLLGYRAIAGVLLVAATLVVLLVAALTLRAAARRQICVPG